MHPANKFQSVSTTGQQFVGVAASRSPLLSERMAAALARHAARREVMFAKYKKQKRWAERRQYVGLVLRQTAAGVAMGAVAAAFIIYLSGGLW